MPTLERLVFGAMRSGETDSGWRKPTAQPLKFDWPFPRTPTRWYNLQSTFVSWAVWSIARVSVAWFNDLRTHNMQRFFDLWKRRGDVPLLTVANHTSCFDDPGIWACIPWSEMRGHALQWRWAPCAAELCFTSPASIKCFSLGKCVPIVRGSGVYQKAVDFCISKLNDNEWVHFYPEGYVNTEPQKHVRLKWGIGRMMSECDAMPIVLPIAQVGMDSVLPNYSPYYLRRGQKVTVLIGEPIQGLTELRDELRAQNASPRTMRKALTDAVQDEFHALIDRAHELHREWLDEQDES